MAKKLTASNGNSRRIDSRGSAGRVFSGRFSVGSSWPGPVHDIKNISLTTSLIMIRFLTQRKTKKRDPSSASLMQVLSLSFDDVTQAGNRSSDG